MGIIRSQFCVYRLVHVRWVIVSLTPDRLPSQLNVPSWHESSRRLQTHTLPAVGTAFVRHRTRTQLKTLGYCNVSPFVWCTASCPATRQAIASADPGHRHEGRANEIQGAIVLQYSSHEWLRHTKLPQKCKHCACTRQGIRCS